MNLPSLLERAKPELLKAIAQYKVDYPSSIERIEKQLDKTFWVIDLPYGTVVELRSICSSVKLDFNINDPWAMFEK